MSQSRKRPQLGQIVHWVNWNGEHLAAIVTLVALDAVVNLHVFKNDEAQPAQLLWSVLGDQFDRTPGTWHFCEEV